MFDRLPGFKTLQFMQVNLGCQLLKSQLGQRQSFWAPLRTSSLKKKDNYPLNEINLISNLPYISESMGTRGLEEIKIVVHYWYLVSLYDTGKSDNIVKVWAWIIFIPKKSEVTWSFFKFRQVYIRGQDVGKAIPLLRKKDNTFKNLKLFINFVCAVSQSEGYRYWKKSWTYFPAPENRGKLPRRNT
jgi:hypothetical protein